jgi:hypothetical protein
MSQYDANIFQCSTNTSMPVIIKPSPEKAGTNTDEAASNSQELLKKASSGWAQPGGGNRDVTIVETEKRRIIQSSFSAALPRRSFHMVMASSTEKKSKNIEVFKDQNHVIQPPNSQGLATQSLTSPDVRSAHISTELITSPP